MTAQEAGRATAQIADLATWGYQLRPSTDDRQMAKRALTDTAAVIIAGLASPIVRSTEGLPAAFRWAAVGHALDFDDVHLPSTSHVSVVCVPAALACGGGETEYLAGAGVMARLGTALGWEHYRRGWHTTCTAGAPGAAVAAGLSLGLDSEGLTRAMALAVSGAVGMQRSFGTDAKPLQVGAATAAGVRAARLAAAGASADISALGVWFDLMGGTRTPELEGPAVPGGLAIKLHPCCYAAQRPISAARALLPVNPGDIAAIRVSTPESALLPLIHPRPTTGSEGKFSLEYAVAATLLDGFPDDASFTDSAVRRPEVADLLGRIVVDAQAGGDGVLSGELTLALDRHDGSTEVSVSDVPVGHPRRPPSSAELAAKVAACAGAGRAEALLELTWPEAAELLHRELPGTGG